MNSKRMIDMRGYIDRSTNLKENLLKGLQHIEWKRLVRSDSRVFVKPNFTFPCYKEGVTTTPDLLESLLATLKDRADCVFVVESNGGNNSFTADEAFRGHQMNDICRNLGVELVNLSSTPAVMISGVVGSRKVQVSMPRILLDNVDCFVSVPVLKVHAMTSVTLSMKNLWGCVPDPMRCLYHNNLDRKLALLTRMLKPTICIVDGTYALDGHGPMFGDPIRLDLLLLANNPVVADALGASIMGYRPRSIGHIRIAEDDGLGTSDLNRVVLNTNWKRFFRQFSFGRTVLDYFSLIPFHNAAAAKLMFQSPFTKALRRVADIVRTDDEKVDLRSYVM